jgi:Gram-negative bacterial TonB protein C-terminal
MLFLKPLLSFSFITCCLFSTAQEAQKDSLKDENLIFTKVESEAEFPGGSPAWIKYLQKNLKSNVAAENGAPVGKYTVIARFIVDKQGVVSAIKADTKLGYGMEQEVVKVISNSGKWQPAMQKGRPVNAYRIQPITFLIESDDFEIHCTEPYTIFTNMDNEITITAGRVKPEHISLTVPGGKVTANGDGKFTVQVKSPGRVLVEIVNTKKDKSIGTASLTIKEK